MEIDFLTMPLIFVYKLGLKLSPIYINKRHFPSVRVQQNTLIEGLLRLFRSTNRHILRIPIDASSYLTPSPGSSGTSMSSKTPGRDLEDRLSQDSVPDV